MVKVFETPDFQSEQEEAEWWDSHQEELADAFEEAVANGTLGRGTLMREGLKAFETLTSGLPAEKDDSKQKSAA